MSSQHKRGQFTTHHLENTRRRPRQNRVGVPCLLSRGHLSCHGYMNYSQLGHRYFLHKQNAASDCCRHSMRNIDVFCVQRWNESINVDLAILLKCDNWLVCFYLVERILWKHISTCWPGGNCCEKYIPFKIIIIFYPGFRNFCGSFFLREVCNFAQKKIASFFSYGMIWNNWQNS